MIVVTIIRRQGKNARYTAHSDLGKRILHAIVLHSISPSAES